MRKYAILLVLVFLSACAEGYAPPIAVSGGYAGDGRHGFTMAGGSLAIGGGGGYALPGHPGGLHRPLSPEELFLRSLPTQTVDGQDWLPRHAVLNPDAERCANGLHPDFSQSKQIGPQTIRVRLVCN